MLLQESKAASELADKVLGDVQRSSNDMAQLNSWLQVRSVCLLACKAISQMCTPVESGKQHTNMQAQDNTIHQVACW
jgi:hypothetical protein